MNHIFDFMVYATQHDSPHLYEGMQERSKEIESELKDIFLHYDIADNGYTVTLLPEGIKNGMIRYCVDIVKIDDMATNSIDAVNKYLEHITEIRNALQTGEGVMGFQIDGVVMHSINRTRIYLLFSAPSDATSTGKSLRDLIDNHPNKKEILAQDTGGPKPLWVFIPRDSMFGLHNNTIAPVTTASFGSKEIVMQLHLGQTYQSSYHFWRKCYYDEIFNKKLIKCPSSPIFARAVVPQNHQREKGQQKVPMKIKSIVNALDYIISNGIKISTSSNAILSSVDETTFTGRRIDLSESRKKELMGNAWMIICE